MEKIINNTTFFILLMIILFSINCASSSKEIRVKPYCEKTNIFTEIKKTDKIEKGFAGLILKASLKTHLKNTYLFSILGLSHHGNPSYQFLLNIDGKAVLWDAKGKIEDTSDVKIFEDGFERLAPEAGRGMKYMLEKRISLKAGSHNIFLSIPEENNKIEFTVTLNSGSTNFLELKPVYRYKKSHHTRSYLQGIKYYTVFLNGNSIAPKP